MYALNPKNRAHPERHRMASGTLRTLAMRSTGPCIVHVCLFFFYGAIELSRQTLSVEVTITAWACLVIMLVFACGISPDTKTV